MTSPPPSSQRTHSAADLASLMSAALGLEKAMSTVVDAFAALGIEGSFVDRETAKRVLDHLSRQPGLVGITGRVALSRFEHGSRAGSGVLRAAVSTTDPTEGGAPLAKRPLTLVSALLAPTLGQEGAQKLVFETAATMQLSEEVELDEALRLLEKITKMSGVVGVAARFAKTRIHLSWSAR